MKEINKTVRIVDCGLGERKMGSFYVDKSGEGYNQLFGNKRPT